MPNFELYITIIFDNECIQSLVLLSEEYTCKSSSWQSQSTVDKTTDWLGSWKRTKLLCFMFKKSDHIDYYVLCASPNVSTAQFTFAFKYVLCFVQGQGQRTKQIENKTYTPKKLGDFITSRVLSTLYRATCEEQFICARALINGLPIQGV